MGHGGSVDSGPPGPLEGGLPGWAQIVSLMFLRFVLVAISVIVVMFRRMIRSYLHPPKKEPPPTVPADETPKEKTV